MSTARLLTPEMLQIIGWVGVVLTFALWAIKGQAEPLFIIPCWALATGGKISSTLAELRDGEDDDA